MSGEFNKKPEQCADCPLDQFYVDKNNAVLTRNCDGPSYENAAFTGSTTVQGGNVVNYDPDKTGRSEIACRNVGLVAWKEAIEHEYLAGSN